MIGTKGFWIDDNNYCEITGVEDEGAGIWEFTSLEPEDLEPTEPPVWLGFIGDFFPEA